MITVVYFHLNTTAVAVDVPAPFPLTDFVDDKNVVKLKRNVKNIIEYTFLHIRCNEMYRLKILPIGLWLLCIVRAIVTAVVIADILSSWFCDCDKNGGDSCRLSIIADLCGEFFDFDLKVFFPLVAEGDRECGPEFGLVLVGIELSGCDEVVKWSEASSGVVKGERHNASEPWGDGDCL